MDQFNLISAVVAKDTWVDSFIGRLAALVEKLRRD